MNNTFSTAYDALVTQIETTFPNHVELINPYVPELNDTLTMEAAYGIAIGPGVTTDREQDCRFSVARDLTVVLTRRIMKGDLARNSSSKSERRSTEKQLIEDMVLLVKAIEGNATLQNASNDLDIFKCVYETDGGLEYLVTREYQNIMIKVIFSLEYVESIN
jgi:hypothetical protein